MKRKKPRRVVIASGRIVLWNDSVSIADEFGVYEQLPNRVFKALDGKRVKLVAEVKR